MGYDCTKCPNPKPRRRLWNPLNRLPMSPMQNLRQTLALLSIEHHGFKALLDERKIPKRSGSLPLISLAKASISLCDLPLNRNPLNAIRFSRCVGLK